MRFERGQKMGKKQMNQEIAEKMLLQSADALGAAFAELTCTIDNIKDTINAGMITVNMAKRMINNEIDHI